MTKPSGGWGGWVPFWPQAWPWEGDKLWILIINAASATPVTATEGGKGVREVGGWEENRENGGTEGQGESGFREQRRPEGLWEFPGGCSKEMVEEKRRVGRKGMRETDSAGEGNEKSRNPLTPRHLKEYRGAGAEGGQAWWKGRLILPWWGREREGTAWASEV